MHPIEGRVPSRATWEDLQRFLAWLPTAVADQRPAEVRLVGGAHLSVAVAFGAALPETAGMPLSAPERWRSRPPGELEGRWYLTYEDHGHPNDAVLPHHRSTNDPACSLRPRATHRGSRPRTTPLHLW